MFGKWMSDCGKDISDIGDDEPGCDPALFTQCAAISRHWM